MPTPSVRLNGLALSRVGFIVRDVPRFLEAPIRTPATIPLAGRMGGVILDSGLVELRELAIEGTFVRDSAALREAAEDQLRAQLGGGLIEIWIRRADGSVRVTHGILPGRLAHDPIGPLFRTRGTRLALTLLCPDATWRTEEPVIMALSATPRTIPHWGAPTDFVVRAHGPGTAIALQLRTAGGLLTTEISLGDLSANEYVELDNGAEAVEEVVAGAAANGLARIGDDPFAPYGITPADGEGQTVALTGGATGELWAWPRML